MISPIVITRRLCAGLALFSAGVGLLGAAESLPAPLPEEIFPQLKDILHTALAQSPMMIQKNIELAQSEGGFLQNRAAMLPNVSTSASYNVSGAAVSANTNVSSTSSGLYYSLSISQPVFQWGRLKAQTDAARIQVNIAEKNYAEAYRWLALTLRRQYLALVGQKLAWRNARFVQQQSVAALALEEDKLRNGQSTESQLVYLRLNTDEAALAAERNAETFASAKRSFARQAGLAELGDDRIADEIPAVAYDPAAGGVLLRQFLGHGWEENLSVQMARDSLRVSELSYKQAQYRLYPMFSLSGSISQSNSTSASLNSVSQVSVLSQYGGVSMSWSIFDGFATRGAKISAMGTRRLSERQLKTTTDGVMDQAQSLERQVGFAHRSMKLWQTRAELSENAVRTMEDDAARGLVPKAAVEATTGAYYTSQLNLLNQRAEFLSCWAEFVSLVGHDPILQEVPAKYLSHVR